MSIIQFVKKYKKVYDITYATLHRLIRIGALKENIHYTKSYRVTKCRYLLNEKKVIQYLETGKHYD